MRVLFAFLLAALGSAKHSAGDIFVDNHQWVLLDTFIFDSNDGHLLIKNVEPYTLGEEGTESATLVYPQQQLLLYHDLEEEGGFPPLYKSAHSCRAKAAKAEKAYNLTGEILMGGKGVLTKIRTQIPRNWFVVLANCESMPTMGKEGVGLSNYEILWMNDKSHVSKEQQGLKPMCWFTLFALIALIAVVSYMYTKLKKDENDLAHQVMRTILVIMAVHSISLILQLMHRGKYERDGEGSPFLANTALGFELVPPIMLVANFVCVAKGKYITTESIRDELRTIVEICALYMVASAALLYWATTLQDPGAKLDYYETDAGIALIVLRMLTMLWFVSSLQKTFRREHLPYKRNFYIGFAVFGALWFLSYPVCVLVAEGTEHYHRTAVLFVLEQIVALITYMVWVALFWGKRNYIRKKAEADHGAIGDMADV